MTKIYLSIRNARGQMQSIDPQNIPVDASAEVRAAAEALAAAMAPKRGRGRPVGYRCSPETVAQMVASRMATLAARKAEG